MALKDVAFGCLAFMERGAAYCQGKGYGSASIEGELALALKMVGRAPALMVDAGGNVGSYTREVRRRAPGCEIHVFEPAAKNIAILRNAFSADPRIHINALAVTDVTQDAELYANESGSCLGSLTKRRLDHFGIHMDHCEPVKTVRFEEYYDSHMAPREIDLAKFDIEGHELGALQGFGEVAIRRTRCIQFEFGGCNIDTRTYFQDFFYFFSEHHFDLFRVTPIGAQPILRYREAHEYFSTANYLARNRNLD